ncbi:ABC transporter ATP-binding protein [Pseudolactococcus yaeyamensis]
MSSHLLIEMNDFGKIFLSHDEGTIIVKNLNFSITKGEFVSIIGKSGSDKSTLLNIIGLLDNKFEGSYRFDNLIVSEMSEEELTKKRNQAIGFVFQNYNLLPEYTVKENILIPNIYSDKKIEESAIDKVLESVGLLGKKNAFPKALSGGQQQRVAIARAIIHEPQIIIADEPTGALDEETGKQIMALLTELNEKGHTILMVTHDLEVAAYSQQKYQLVDETLVKI